MSTTEPLRCVVVSPERVVLERDASMVVLPAFDGEAGILPNHAPMVARLGAGELKLTHKDGHQVLFLEGGFAQVRDNVVTVLATSVHEISDLKEDKLEAELAELTAQVATTIAARKDRSVKLDRVRTALRIARRPKRY